MTRRTWLGLTAIIVMLELAFPQRAGGQWRAEFLPGVRFGPPLRAGLALGVAYGTRVSFAHFAGPVGIAEVGIGGARASLGYLFALPYASGIELLGSVVRTSRSVSQAGVRQTLAGGEMRISFFAMNLGVGVFRPVRTESDRRTRVYLNAGLGV